MGGNDFRVYDAIIEGNLVIVVYIAGSHGYAEIIHLGETTPKSEISHLDEMLAGLTASAKLDGTVAKQTAQLTVVSFDRKQRLWHWDSKKFFELNK